jgi:hypothetical protein
MLVDCGATTHIVCDESRFIRFDGNFDPSSHFIELADRRRTNNIALKSGDACVKLVDSAGKVCSATLKDALYIPSFAQDIFSVQAATENGATVELAVLHADGTKFNIDKRGKLYFLNKVVEKRASNTLRDWHEILGHCNTNDVLKLENVVDGMVITERSEFECGVCIKGKMTQHRNRNPDRRATSALELVHFDLAGPIDPEAKDGFRYALGCVDDYSGLIMIYFLKQKSDTLYATEKFLADVAPYGKVRCIRSDQGGEFTSEAFESLLMKHVIKHECSAAHSPHQNGTVERSWRTIFEMARCLLLQSKLPKCLWTYAVMASAYTRNRCFNPRTGRTPCQSFTGVKPNISNLQKFGSVCYAKVQNPKKLDDRGERGIFVSYDRGSPAYLVYFSENEKIRKVRCVSSPKNL